MRILAIRGKNLASIEGEFEIDFRKEPLCSAGIFAITGPTGAGKSTILDAMCIALYSRTPRLNNITNCNAIEVHGKKEILENNINTILRRGKSEGYAEVDFKAVDGNEYRTRWSIARAKNNPAGNFKTASYDVTNLTTGEHTIYTVTEHKALLPKLIGLTFEQFTRAVLLAQGNFTAFLKAEDNEKATILQTLTGTEIYKRISEIIYRRNDEAKKELALIEEKKRGLVILTDEEVAELNKNKSNLLKEQEAITKEQQIVATKKNWLERMTQQQDMLAISDKEISDAKQDLEEAAPHIELLKRIDSVQDVRDKYTSLCRAEQQCSIVTKEIGKLETEYNIQKVEFTKACESTTVAIEKQEKLNNEWLEIQPRILKAVKLEEQNENESKREKELINENEQLKNEYNGCSKEINIIRNKIEILNREQKNISDWFLQNRCYENVIQYIPSIIVNTASAKNDSEHINNKSKQLAKAEELLNSSVKQLETTIKRKEELENTLSSEIASLREKLIDGEPCPVCGSRHHEVLEAALNILEEKELEKEKKDVSKTLEYLEKSIEDRKTEIAGLRSAIELHREAVEEATKKSIEFLQGIENPKELLQREDISSFLNSLKTNWNSNKEKESNNSEELATRNGRLEPLVKRSAELVLSISLKQKQIDEIQSRIKENKRDIESILGGKTSAKALQEHYNTQIANVNKTVAAAMENKTAIAGICNKLNGQLAEKNKLLTGEKEIFIQLQKEIDEYLSKRNDNMSFEQLKDTLSISQAETSALRENIEILNKAIATAIATKTERERNIEEHKKAEIKPDKNENTDSLQSSIDNFAEKNRRIIEELANINATLLKNNENCHKFAEYKEECDKKQKLAENIGILNSAFGSANGDKLSKYVQGYTLEILLSVANQHLKEITGRYEMARISNESLGIKIIDLDMLSETRSVHSLSGGETFLVSLALSLALSSISSNSMSIESLFIDEGFGALDSSTLKTVMGALDRLQNQGRTIGVISHYSEMLEQIPVKVAVIKQNSGRSKIEIKEN